MGGEGAPEIHRVAERDREDKLGTRGLSNHSKDKKDNTKQKGKKQTPAHWRAYREKKEKGNENGEESTAGGGKGMRK